MTQRSTLGRVRGLGSAKDGTAHWWAQRVTAVAMVPLSLWFVASIAANTGADHAAFAAWIGHPLVAIVMLLVVLAGFHHAQLGIQVVIEDYVHTEWLKIASIMVVKLAAVALGVGAAFAILKLAFGG
jgi:succinate dehydrogenase / fumarate reductase membrane anchor subunit